MQVFQLFYICCILGVIIQTVEPGVVTTNMFAQLSSGSSKPLAHMVMAGKYASTSVDNFVKSAVNTIGWSNYVNGHVVHYMFDLIGSVQSEVSQTSGVLADLED